MTTTITTPALAGLDLNKLQAIADRVDARGLFNASCDIREWIESARAALARRTAQPVAPVQDTLEPVAHLRWWARQYDAGHGNIGHDEGFEVCEPSDRSDDGSPAFPVYASAAAAQEPKSAEVLTIPTAIMGISVDARQSDEYKRGRRDARHAAADLVLARADELKALATPYPQVAEGAPSIDTPAFRSLLEGAAAQFHRTEIWVHELECWPSIVEHIDGHTRSAIAASRRAVLYEVAAWYVDKGWMMDEDDIAGAIRCLATPAPASAGQAAPAPVADSARALLACLDGLPIDTDEATTDQLTAYDRTRSRLQKSLSAQSAEGAGQAGQVAKCDVCGSTEYSCNGCAKTISTERAAAPAEHKHSFAADGYCLDCDAKEPQPEKKGSK